MASSPACFSTKRADFSKRVNGWSRLFKDVLSPVRFWVRSISGASGRSRSQTQRWRLCFPGPPRTSGSCGILHRVPTLLGWTSGFSGGVALVFSAPLRCHSFRKCMRSLQAHGRHLLLPEINLVAPPPSPPSMVEPLWGTRASPLWSGLWPCSCVQQSLPLCGVNRVSPHGPVSTRQASLAVLIEPVGRRLLPYTPWR